MTIKNQNGLIFTRYLYVKDEVEISLLVSILNKSDDSLFWAYELYYSGFKSELFDMIWKIYYDFFSTLNPTFESYLLKKHKEVLENTTSKDNDTKDSDRIISSIIQSLLFRPFNTDVFFMRNICSNFEVDIIYHNGLDKLTNIEELFYNMKEWIATNDYRSISQWILNNNKNSINNIDVYSTCLDIFEENGLQLTKGKLLKDFKLLLKSINNINNIININVVLLAKIMSLFSKKHQLKKGKSIYINVEPEDIIPYETIIGSNELPHYRVLEKVYICGIDDLKHLSLFKLKRHKYNLKERYWDKWLYYASFSPLWSQRIKQHNGTIDMANQKVIFLDDDLMEEFYGLYGLEPDEQKQCVQNKSVMNIEKIHNWKWFNNKYKRNGLFDIWEEELEEFEGLQL